MKRTMCKSKIHRAKVTEARLDYVGSITIDKNILRSVNIMNYEQVHVLNVTNGNRFITYAIEGPANSGTMCVNGAGAHLASAGDLIIVISYAEYDEKELENFKPIVAIMNDKNEITELSKNRTTSFA